MSRLNNVREGALSVLKYIRDGLSISSIYLQFDPDRQSMYNCLLHMNFESMRNYNEEGHVLGDLRFYPTINRDGSGQDIKKNNAVREKKY